ISFCEGQNIPSLERFGQLFPDAPTQELTELYTATSDHEKSFCYNPLYIATHHLLIDSGSGESTSADKRIINQMAAAGIAAEEVQTVFITHAHGDHINGLFNAEKGLVFPNARYLIGQEEWDFWMYDGGSMSEDYLAERRGWLGRLEKKVTLSESGDALAPNIIAID